MEFKVLKSPLDKGETWEEKNTRIIEVCKSSDYSPSVCFGIFKEVGVKKKKVITEDFHFDTADAIAIGKEMIKVAKSIEKQKEYDYNHLVLPPQRIKGKIVKGLTRKELDKLKGNNKK